MIATTIRTTRIAEPDERQAVLAELPPGELPLVERLEADLVVLGRASAVGVARPPAARRTARCSMFWVIVDLST